MFAQTAPPKSVLINTLAFYEQKTGITKLLKAAADLNVEFAADLKALNDKNVKLRALADEIDGLQKQPVTSASQAAIAAKQTEGESLKRTIDYTKSELEARVAKRREAVIGAITFDIGKAIAEFGKKNGYGAIFDASKLEESGALLFVAENMDITKEFIAFYNARAASVPVAK
jgi:Skp family chaperone for outer membrane proteins